MRRSCRIRCSTRACRRPGCCSACSASGWSAGHGAVADRLARIVRPVERAGGDRRAARRRATSTPGSSRPVRPRSSRSATSLNRLAGRIGELLAAERELVADLSHRLRTPITALRLDADGAARRRAERERVSGDVDELVRAVDRLIDEARRPMREGVGAACDLAEVTRERVAFWAVLAEDQGRTSDSTIADGGPCGWPSTPTTSRPRSTRCSATCWPTRPRASRSASWVVRRRHVVVEDEGPGSSGDPDAHAHPGNERRELDRPRARHRPPDRRGVGWVARARAVAAGGGARVTVRFGLVTETRAHPARGCVSGGLVRSHTPWEDRSVGASVVTAAVRHRHHRDRRGRRRRGSRRRHGRSRPPRRDPSSEHRRDPSCWAGSSTSVPVGFGPGPGPRDGLTGRSTAWWTTGRGPPDRGGRSPWLRLVLRSSGGSVSGGSVSGGSVCGGSSPGTVDPGDVVDVGRRRRSGGPGARRPRGARSRSARRGSSRSRARVRARRASAMSAGRRGDAAEGRGRRPRRWPPPTATATLRESSGRVGSGVEVPWLVSIWSSMT